MVPESLSHIRDVTDTETLPSDSAEPHYLELLEPISENVIKPVVRHTLRVSLREADTSAENQDALELVGDIQVLLLSALETNTGEQNIQNVDAYAATIATNSCYQYLRNKFPVRAQQMNRLRYLLTHDERFELQKRADGDWWCRLSGNDSYRHATTPERQRYIIVVSQLLAARSEPVPFDDLVQMVMDELRLHERRTITAKSDDAEDDPFRQARDRELSHADKLETNERLRRLWHGILQMPLQHRKALLLNLRDSDGGVIWALPVSGIAHITDIAAALEMTPDELAAIWNELPWDDLRIAEHLGLRRQQIINLRHAARAKLFRLEGTSPSK